MSCAESKSNFCLYLEEASEPSGPGFIKGTPSPYATPRIGVALLEVGVDEFYESECYVWCSIVAEDGEWELVEDGEAFSHEAPTWYVEDIGEAELSYLLTKTHSTIGLMSWALKEGIAPSQRFLVYVSKPRWYRSSYEYNEWDYDCEVEVLRREPSLLTVRDFEKEIDEVFCLVQARERQIEDNRKAQWDKRDRLFLRWSWGHSYDASWCEVALCSSLTHCDNPEHHGIVRLMTYRSDSGDKDEALEGLTLKVSKEDPDLDLRSLPVRCSY